MGKSEGLYLWLMEWKMTREQSEQSWRRLGKGTEVRIVSSTYLLGLCEKAQEAVQIGSEVPDLDIDNSDILDQGSLRYGLEAGVHYEPIPVSLYNAVFPITAQNSRNVPKGWIVWNGLFRPQIFLEGFRITVIIAKEKRIISYRLEVTAGETLSTFLGKYEGIWKEESSNKSYWWTCTSNIDPDSLQSQLLSSSPGEIEVMQMIVAYEKPLFTQINALVIYGDYRSPPMIYSRGYTQGMGLVNIGKTCFLNSALQVIIHLPQVIVLYIHQNPRELGRMAQLLIEVLKRRYGSGLGTGMTYKPAEIYSLLPLVHTYSEKRDEDANEFFLVLLELLHISHSKYAFPPMPEDLPNAEHYAWLHFLRSDSPLRAQIFSGLLKNTLQCCNCPHVSYRFTPFCTLPLDLPPCKSFHISLVRQDINKPQESVLYESETALEENEILNNVRDHVVSYTGVREVIVGENRGSLLDSGIGLSNIVASNQFIALEIPQLDTENCAVLVDIWYNYQPLATRILKIPNRIPLKALGEEVASYLLALEQSTESQGLLTAYLPTWLPTLTDQREKAQLAYRDLLLGHSVEICELDGSRKYVHMDIFERQGMHTVGELYTNGGGKMPRIRFNSPNISSNLRQSLKSLEPKKGFWSFILGGKTDSDLCVTLLQLLEYSLRDKPMNEEDTIACDQCHCRTQQIASTKIARLPQVLVIVLQRVRYLPTGLQKSHIRIHYPLTDLNLSSFEHGSMSYPAIYDLQAVICHKGSGLTRGHYTAYVLSPVTDSWLRCDDEHVQEVADSRDVISEEGAYMLFYARRS